MNRYMIVFCLSLFILLIGCSKNNTVLNPPTNGSGGITFKIDRISVPSGVTLITASLTRSGFNTISKNLNLLTDSTAEITIPSVQTGSWHLKVDAKDTLGTILYTGETDVIVQENYIVQLSLNLNPVNSGTGSISIFVTWGTSSSNQWIDFPGNPIMTRSNNPSLPNAISMGRVILDNGLYKMWYCAIYNSGVSNIWYAESQNGITWNTVGNSPVLTPGSLGSWDSYSIVPSAVIKEYNQYKLYYMGCSSLSGMLSVGLATSSDGINWQKYSIPVMAADNQYFIIGVTDVIKKDSMYLAYFGYNNSRAATNNKIGVATSYNGINWTMYSGNPILIPTFTWEGGSIHHPSVIFENNYYKMVYGNAVEQNAVGLATSADGFNFVKQTSPVFGVTNTVNNLIQTSYPYYRKFNNVSYIYYSGVNYNKDVSIYLARNFGD